MSKGEQKTSREKKKPKQEGKTKHVSEYASRNASAAPATPFVKPRKK